MELALPVHWQPGAVLKSVQDALRTGISIPESLVRDTGYWAYQTKWHMQVSIANLPIVSPGTLFADFVPLLQRNSDEIDAQFYVLTSVDCRPDSDIPSIMDVVCGVSLCRNTPPSADKAQYFRALGGSNIAVLGMGMASTDALKATRAKL